ncbi:hypothetical protein DFS34DRAFT_697342 [Phlyctochytrium arcticum]|nr:hypothetical protein DFS34DRAFT_697342 [Phlyctochytrium arcticum]
MNQIEENGDWIGIPFERSLSEQQQWHIVIGVILHMCALLFSVLGVTVFICTPGLRTGPTQWHNWIIFYASFGDFCLNVFQVGTIIDMALMQKWRHTEAWCQFQGYLTITGGYISILGLGLLTQERAHTILMKKTWTGLHTGIGIALCTTVAFGNVALSWWGGNVMALQESGIYCAPDWGGCLRPQPYPKFVAILTILNGIIVFISTFHLTGIYIAIWLSVRNTARRLTSKDTTGSLTMHKLNVPKSLSKSISRGYDTPLARNNTAVSEAPDHLPAVIFSKLEQDIARKCAIMVTSFLISWAPHTSKMLIVGFTQRPISAQFDMVASLLAICPGISNPLINYLFDHRWRNACTSLFARITLHFTKAFATISGAFKRHTEAWCQFQGYMLITGGYMSILGLSLLTQERAHTILLKKTWTGLHTGIGVALCTTFAFGNIAMSWWGGNKMALQESGIYCAPDYGGCLRPQPYPKFQQILTIFSGIILVIAAFHLTGIYIAIWLFVRNTARRLISKDTSGTTTMHKLNGYDVPLARNNTAVSEAPDLLPAVIFSKLEQDIARKCAIMVTSFLISWAPYFLKMLIVSFTQRQTGTSNPLINYWFDYRWRHACISLFARITLQISKASVIISGAYKRLVHQAIHNM